MNWTIRGSQGAYKSLGIPAAPATLDILMRSSLLLIGLLLFALTALPAQAQIPVLPDSPNLNLHPTHNGNSSDNALASVDNPAMPGTSPADTPSAAPNAAITSNGTVCGVMHLVRCLKDLGGDEKGIFTSPLHVRSEDAYWLMPLGAATGLAFAYDTDAESAIGVDSNRTNIANTITDFGSYYATGAESAGIYFLGLAKKNPKLAETGRLGAEAILASGTVTLVTKMASNRQRPLQGNGQGNFWADGANHWEFDSSFPSDHATASMALARVVAGEYPHWYVILPAYGFAESIGISRILANQHFPSDVLVGQAIGFLSGGYVLRHHARYLRGKNTFANNIMSSIKPIADPSARAVGANLEIPLGR